MNMIPWTVEEMIQSTAYGKLWLVMDVRGGKMHCRRIRRKMKGEQYQMYADEKKIFLASANKGELLFQDSGKNVITLIPDPETEFGKHVAKIIDKGK